MTHHDLKDKQTVLAAEDSNRFTIYRYGRHSEMIGARSNSSQEASRCNRHSRLSRKLAYAF